MLSNIDVFNNLTAILNRASIKYTTELPTTAIVGNFTLNTFPASTIFHIAVTGGGVVNHTYLMGFHHQLTTNLLQFINIVNTRMLIGNFEYVVNNESTLRFKCALPGSMIKEEYSGEVMSLVQLPSMMFARYINGFFAVVNQGLPPHEAAFGCDGIR